jgi:acetylornithine deacetylase/succinyl-diaminopimelate desuccinylase family protein
MSDIGRMTDKAFSGIDTAATSQALSELVAARSDNPGAYEGKAAEVFARQCREAGLLTEIIPVRGDRANIVARVSSGRPGPVVLLNSHLDTVQAGEGWSFDPWQGSIKDGRIWGLGSTDAKGQLIAMLAATIAVKRLGLPVAGEILVTAVIDEEVASEGARSLAPSLHADYAIVGEPTLLEVGIAHRGSIRPRFSVIGRAAHSSMPQLGKNAIFKSLPLLQRMQDYCDKVGEISHPLIGPAVASVTSIAGGINPSTIPDRCDILMDRRMVPGEDPAEVLQHLRNLITEVAQHDPDFDASIVEFLPVTGPPSEISGDAPLVKMALEAVEHATGIPRKPRGVTFGCDMTHFRAAKIDAIVMGPGDIARAHKPDEFIEIEELIAGARAYSALLIRLLHHEPPAP